MYDEVKGKEALPWNEWVIIAVRFPPFFFGRVARYVWDPLEKKPKRQLFGVPAEGPVEEG